MPRTKEEERELARLFERAFDNRYSEQEKLDAWHEHNDLIESTALRDIMAGRGGCPGILAVLVSGLVIILLAL